VLTYLAADFPLAVSIAVSNAVHASKATANSGSGIYRRLNKARY
jgi:hypothetical protein